MTPGDDPLVHAYRREGELLLRTWASGSKARAGAVKRDYRTFICINRARLLRARLAQSGDPAKRAKIARDALVGAR